VLGVINQGLHFPEGARELQLHGRFPYDSVIATFETDSRRHYPIMAVEQSIEPNLEALPLDETDDDDRARLPPRPTLKQQLLDALKPNRLIASMIAGSVTGILSITSSIAFASLIFSGEFAAHAAAGIGFLLFGGIIIGLTASLFSSANGVLAGVQDSGVAVLSVMALAILAALPAGASSEARYLTLIASIMTATLLTGLVFLLLGFLKLGNLIRFIPYPVVGGFLSGSGLLLVSGGIKLMTGAPLEVSLVTPELVLHWLPGLAFAVILILAMRKIRHFLVLPGAIVGSAAVFFIVLAVTNTSIPAASAQGWLLSSPGSNLWQPVGFSALWRADWGFITSHIGTLFSVAIVVVISLLLNASSIELQTRQDVDLNHELKVLGATNLLAGLAGSPPGGLYLGSTVLVHNMGAATRLVGVAQSLVMALVLFAGASMLAFVPKFVLGGLILFFGLNFLLRWVVQARSELPTAEYVIVLLILGVIFTMGFLPGVTFGVIVAVILFVVNYSRINVIKHELSGANHTSTVERPRLYRDLLRRKGHWLYMLKLQGFIFFGTANTLFTQFRARIENPEMQRPRYFLLDFHHVTGVDSSAMLSFQKMMQLAKQHEITLIFTSLSEAMKLHLSKEPFASEQGRQWVMFSSLDYGMEWYEDQIIEDFGSVGFAVKPPTMTRELQRMLRGQSAVERMMGYFERIEAPSDTVLIKQGESPRGIYFVEEGQMRIELQIHDQRAIRLRTMSSGTVFGELGTYLNVQATACVIAEKPALLFFLSGDALKQMEKNDPDIASAFHRFMAHVMAERLVSSTAAMKVLLD
jgi:sulfate permease, SulP family